MLVIRNTQMQALQEAVRAGIEDLLLRHIERNFQSRYLELTDQGKDEKQIRHLIHSAIERAVKYGVNAEPDVCRFVEMSVTIAPEFELLDEWRWAKAILDDNTMSGGAKMALIKASQ